MWQWPGLHGIQRPKVVNFVWRCHRTILMTADNIQDKFCFKDTPPKRETQWKVANNQSTTMSKTGSLKGSQLGWYLQSKILLNTTKNCLLGSVIPRGQVTWRVNDSSLYEYNNCHICIRSNNKVMMRNIYRHDHNNMPLVIAINLFLYLTCDVFL